MAKADTPLLLDIHVIVWMATGDPRLSRIDRNALLDPRRELQVSAFVAFERTDLQQRGRIAMTEPIDFPREHMEFRIVGFPDRCWRLAAQLPPIHRNLVDRMLIAHALTEGCTLTTADANIRKYPVPFV